MNPFDYVNSINTHKRNLMVGSENDELAEKEYVPFLTNKALSYHTETLLYSNEMNRYAFLPNKLQSSTYCIVYALANVLANGQRRKIWITFFLLHATINATYNVPRST